MAEAFRPTPSQRRFYEGKGRLAPYHHYQRHSRRYATEIFIVATAANPEQAALALEDLDAKGFALLSDDGMRVEPPKTNGARFTIMHFDDDLKPRPESLDAD